MSQQASKPVVRTTFETVTGEVNLTPATVRQYLVNGQGNVTDQEVMMFIGLCKANKLNPFNKDAYLIKYGSQPASTIVSKDVFFRRAISNPQYNGMKSGIIVLTKDSQIQKRDGAIYVKSLGEEIIGAWAEVFRKDWDNNVYQEVNFNEFAGTKKDGALNSNWAGKPAVMILKVAEATALRKAFTDEMQQMYISEEITEPETPFETTGAIIDEVENEIQTEEIEEVVYPEFDENGELVQ